MTKIMSEHLESFKELYMKHFWVNLNDWDTKEYAEELVNFVKILLLSNEEKSIQETKNEDINNLFFNQSI